MALDVALRQQHKTESLRPFGNDVANNLPPFPLGIHFREKNHPADSCDQEKNTERMIAQEPGDARRQYCLRQRLTLPRISFVQVLRRKNHEHYAGPIGDGIPEERTNVRAGVRKAIHHKPQNQDAARNNGQRMLVKKTALSSLRFRHFESPHATYSEPSGRALGGLLRECPYCTVMVTAAVLRPNSLVAARV